MLLINDFHLVGFQRNHESLGDEHHNQTVAQRPLEFTLGVNEGEDRVKVIPNKGPDIGHDEEAVEAGLNGEAEHLKGANCLQIYSLSVS